MYFNLVAASILIKKKKNIEQEIVQRSKQWDIKKETESAGHPGEDLRLTTAPPDLRMLPEWSDRGPEEVVPKKTGNAEDAFKIWLNI